MSERTGLFLIVLGGLLVSVLVGVAVGVTSAWLGMLYPPYTMVLVVALWIAAFWWLAGHLTHSRSR